MTQALTSRRPRILKLAQSDETREIEFEVDFLLSLTFEQRFKMMQCASQHMREALTAHGHRKPSEIVKRK
jgi:hypothetical protein